MAVLCRFVLIAAWLAPGILYAQPAITGRVRDPAENPVPYCNVFVEKEGRMARLTQTDEQGHYELTSLDSGAYQLSVTSIGYKKYMQGVRIKDESLVIDVVLLSDTVTLDQVIVHDKGPIQLKGDTVIYDATYFKSGEEVALGDLLKKLPGITVDDAGKVKFKGKEVVKVKIEDDDLFDNNYQILSKSLSADLVEQVEVLQNYSDNRLLKNIEDSEDVALNLSLKKDRKRQLFGDGRMETNMKQYDGRLNLMSLARKTKVYLLANGNNIGSDPGGEAEELMKAPVRLPGRDAGAEYIVPNSKPFIPEFKKDRYYFNDVLLGSLNSVFRPAKNLKVSVHGLGYRDKTEFVQAMKTEYFTIFDTTGFNELSITPTHDRFGYLQAYADYDASESMTVRYRGRLDAHQGSTVQQNSLNLNNVSKDLTSRTDRQDHLISINRKVSPQSVVGLDIRFVSDKRPQHLFVDGNLFSDYFLPFSPTDTLDQSSEYSSRYWTGQLNWFMRSGIGKLVVKVGYEHYNQKLETNLVSLPSELSRNSLANNQGWAFAESQYALSLGKFVLTPGVSLQLVDTDLSDRPGGSFAFINPKLGFRWRFSDKSRLSAVYTQSQATSALNQLTQSPILEDYNKLAVNDDGFRRFATRTILATYEYGDWTSGYSFFANLYHQETPSGYLSNTDIEPNYVVSTMNTVADKQLSSLSLSVDKYMKGIKTNLKVSLRGSRFAFVTATEGILVPTSSFTQSIEASLRTGFAGAFNVHGGGSMQSSGTESNLIDASNYNLMAFVDGYLNLLDRRLNLTLHWERFELASVSGRPSFQFVDFNARFAIRENKGIAFLLKGRNLLDENVFAQRYVSNQSVAISTNRLIPRYILAGVEFRF